MDTFFRPWLVLLLLVLLAGFARAQSLPRLIPYRQGALWGYADPQHRVRIKPAYDDVTFFHRGWARVMLDGRCAYLDSTGRLLTPLVYSSLGYFHQGRAAFARDGRCGYLDFRGREVLVLDTARHAAFPPLVAQARASYRKNGRTIPYEPLPLHAVVPDTAEAPYTSVNEFYQNWAVVVRASKGRSQPPRYYYLNRQGRFLTDSSLTQLERHVGGVVLINGNTLLDTTGRVLYRRPGLFIRPSYRNPGHHLHQDSPPLTPDLWLTATTAFDERGYQLPPGTRFGLVDARGHEVLAPVYARIEPLGLPEGAAPYPRRPATLFLVTEAGGRQFLFDHSRHVRTASYDYLRPTFVRPLGDYLFVAGPDAQPRLLDRADHALIPPGFTEISLREAAPVSSSAEPVENRFGFVTVKQDQLLGLYDYRGRQLAPPRYTGVHIFADGIAGVISPARPGEFYDVQGTRLGPAALLAHRRRRLRLDCQTLSGDLCYRTADTLYHVLPDSLKRHLVLRTTLEGRFLVILYEPLRNKQRTSQTWAGVLDTTGRVVVPFQQGSITSLRPGYYVANRYYDHRQQLYDPRGNVIITGPDSLLGRPGDGFTIARLGALFTTTSGRRSLVYDSTGRVLDAVPRTVAGGRGNPPGAPILYAAGSSHGYALFDQQGRARTGFDYADGMQFNELLTSGLLWVQTVGKWGFVDARGRPRVGFQFEGARSFHEGRAAVQVAGRWGFIDSTGTLSIAAQYDSVSNFESGLALTINHSYEYQYVDRQGRPALADQLLVRYAPRSNPTGLRPKHDARARRTAAGQRIYHEIGPFYNGRALVRIDMRFGYLDPRGREVIPIRYYYPSPFTGQYAWEHLDQKLYLLDRNGKRVDESKTASGTNGFRNGLAVVGSDYEPGPNQPHPIIDLGSPQERVAGYLYWLQPNGRRPEHRLLRLHEDVADRGIIITQDFYGHETLPVEAGLPEPAVRLLVPPPDVNGRRLAADTARSTHIYSLADGKLLHRYAGQVVAPFHQGLARATHAYAPTRPEGRQPQQNAVGFIRPDGQVVIPYQYQHAGELAEGLIPVQQPRQAGYLGPDGRPFFSE